MAREGLKTKEVFIKIHTYNPLLILSTLLCLLLFNIAHAEPIEKKTESILSFVSTIIVNPDSSIDVTEKTTVYTQQIQMKSVLTRSLPQTYTDSTGVQHALNYQVQQVSQNNVATSYQSNISNSNAVIKIGDANQLLPIGTHTYTMQYHVDHAVVVLKDQAEFNWNVIGTQWNIPILSAAAQIRFPPSTTITAFSGTINPPGIVNKDIAITQLADNQVSFVTQNPLKTGTALTIKIITPATVFLTSSSATQKKAHRKNNLMTLSIITLLLLFCYIGMKIYHHHADR